MFTNSNSEFLGYKINQVINFAMGDWQGRGKIVSYSYGAYEVEVMEDGCAEFPIGSKLVVYGEEMECFN